MSKPNKLSKFMCQLSNYKYHFNGTRRYFRRGPNNDFTKYIFNNDCRNDTFSKIQGSTENLTISLDPKLSNGYASSISGRGCDIANALLFGYYTSDDMAALSHINFNNTNLPIEKQLLKRLYNPFSSLLPYAKQRPISKRTAERLLHFRKQDKYHHKRPHIKHVITLNNIEDDFFYHYSYNKTKKQYYLTKNNKFGRWRSKQVVAEITLAKFNKFNKLNNSNFIKNLRKRYKYTTHLQMLHQILISKQQLYKYKLKHQILLRVIQFNHKYEYDMNNDTLYFINVDLSNKITNREQSPRFLTCFPILSKSLFITNPNYAIYLIDHKYHYSMNEWKFTMKYMVTDAFMYVYLFQILSYKYKHYDKVYHSDKYNLITKPKWDILRFIEPSSLVTELIPLSLTEQPEYKQ